MNLADKCALAGIGNGTAINGRPVVDGCVIDRVSGVMKAFTIIESPKPWENPYVETPEFSQAILDAVEAIEANDLESLPQEAQDAISAEESDEAVSEIVGSRRFLKITHWFLLKAMKYYYSQNPAYLADWHAAVDRLYPDAKPWD